MNLIICIIGYFFAILAMNVSDANSYDLREVIMRYPYYSGYKLKDTLDIEIGLRNIPTGVTEYIILCQEVPIVEKKIGKYIKNENIPISIPMEDKKIWIDVQLWTKTYLCTTKTIAEGRSVTKSLVDWRFKRDDRCLQASRPCVIEVDLKDECKDNSIPATFDCNKEFSQFICTTHTSLQVEVLHQWYQEYSGESLIGNIPLTRAKLTKLIITLESFDNNTVVINNQKSTTVNEYLSLNKGLITLLTNESIKDYNVITLKYSDTKDVYFNCTEYLIRTQYTQVGLINTTAQKINTFNTADVHKNFKKADNGSVLCCLFYIIFDGSYEKHIHRFVSNKTLLLYEDTGSSSFEPSGNVTPASPVEYTVYYTVAAVIGIFFLILVTFILFKRFYRRNSNSEVTLELNTDSNANRVLYADLDLLRGDQRPCCNEESPYAHIIGVLKPRDANIIHYCRGRQQEH